MDSAEPERPRQDGAQGGPHAPIRFLAGVLDSLHVGLCLFDAEDRTLLWNRTFLRLFPEHDGQVFAGEPYAANLRRFYASRLPGESVEAIDQRIAEGIARHRQQTQPYVFEHRGQWVRVASERLPSGERIRIWTPIARLDDATRLASSDEETPLAEVMPFAGEDGDGITLADAEGRIIQANRRFAACFGLCTAEHAHGLTHAALYEACWRDAAPEAGAAGPQLETLIEAERFTGAPFELPLPGGRWVRVLQQRLHDNRVVSTFADITAMKAMERDLRAAREAAERSNRAKDGVLAMVSHELRTPMNGIVGMLDLLDDGRLRQDQTEQLRHARQSAEALLGLLDDILLFSRLEAGPVAIERTPAAPAELIGGIIRLLQPQAARKGLTLRWLLAGDLPARILCDAQRLRQVLLNLAGNAVKFTETGEVTVTARRGRPLPDGGAVIEFQVEDTGIGIPPATLEAIFQPFTQADSSISRRFGGTGLGLSICRHLVQAMDGSITVRSTVGRGSSFLVTIPCPAEAAAASAPPARPRPPTALAGRRALVVDDHPTNREVARLYLERLGLQVVTAAGGDEALAACREPFDVILVDLEMPGMDGFATTRAIRESGLPGAAAAIVAVTAHAGREHRARCAEAGMQGFIAKPINAEALLAAIGGAVAPAAAPAEAPLPVASSPVLDQPRVRLLAAHLSPADWQDIVESFAAACETMLADLPMQGDDDRAATMHRLKGAAWNLGAQRLGDLAAALQHKPAAVFAAQRAELARVLGETLRALRQVDAAA